MKIPANSLNFVLCLGLSAAAVLLFTGCATGRQNPNTRELTDDKSVQLRVATALGDNPDCKFEGVSVTVSNGLIRLGGFVDDFTQKVKAGDIVMRVSGVKDVEDNIVVKEQGADGAGQPEADQSLKTLVRSVLSENPGYQYDEVNVAVSEDTVQLSGFVITAEQKSRAGDLARAVPGVRNVLNNITVKVIL